MEKEFLSPEWLVENCIIEERTTYTCKSNNIEVIENAINQFMLIAGAYINFAIRNDSIGFNYGALKEYRLGWHKVKNILIPAIKKKTGDRTVEYIAVLNVTYFSTSSLSVSSNGAKFTVYRVFQDIGSDITGVINVEESIKEGLFLLKRVIF